MKPNVFLRHKGLNHDFKLKGSSFDGSILDLLNDYKQELIEQCNIPDVSKRTLKRICEHEDCNKEFTVEMNIYADKTKANVAMVNCPHCSKRNDLWLELS